MVRLLVLDKSPVSVAAAFRLAKFFKTTPEHWLKLQMEFDLATAAGDKSLAKELSGITEIDKYSFVRKPHAPKTGTTTAKKKPAGKVSAAKPGRRKGSVKAK
jgi:hypothetical protein